MTNEYGIRAENWTFLILERNGCIIVKSSREEDCHYKVDFWIKYNNTWFAIQFSIDWKEMISNKGKDALFRGVVPIWLNYNNLEKAINGNKKEECNLVKKFWESLKGIVNNYPIKTFQNHCWE